MHISAAIPDQPDFHPEHWATVPLHPTVEDAPITSIDITLSSGTQIAIGGWHITLPDLDPIVLDRDHTYTINSKHMHAAQLIDNTDGGAIVWERTDQQLADGRRALVQSIRDDRIVLFETNKDRWATIEADLPPWLRDRIDNFRRTGGENFLIGGWGYELAVAQLADHLDTHGIDTDTDAFNQLANDIGASGNQVDVARSLARMHAEGTDITFTPSALLPITGDPYYENNA